MFHFDGSHAGMLIQLGANLSHETSWSESFNVTMCILDDGDIGG